MAIDAPVQRALPALESLEGRVLLSSGRGLAGYYFEGTDFTQVKFKREDPQLHFNWQKGSPDPSLGDSGFGARWSGRVQPKFSETYHFYTRTTGGVRLWVNNKLLVDDWSTHPLKDNKGSIALKAGVRYDLRVEYFDTSAASRVELHWASARQSREPIPQMRMFASEFDTTPPTAATRLRATYVTDRAYKLVWNPATDDSGTVVYDVYTGKTRMGATTGTSFARGGRNPLNNYAITVRAVDFAGNVTVSSPLLITTKSPFADGDGIGLAAKYFSAPDFTDFTLTRTDPQLALSGIGGGSDLSRGGSFSARWEGRIEAKYDELYTFHLHTGSAVRLWVGGQLLIDQPSLAAATEHRASKKLRAGRTYEIRVEYQHLEGQATLTGSWSSLSTQKQLIPASQFQPAFVDSTPPTIPLSLRMEQVTERTASIRWDASSDDVGVVRYHIYRGDVHVGLASGTSFTEENLQPNTSYTYTVVAVDGASRASSPSGPLMVTTKQVVTRDALSTIPAVDYNDGSGVSRAGGVITDLDNGDWVKFDAVDFGSGVNSWRVRLGATVSAAGGAIELRLGSPSGTLIGSHVVQATGSYGTHYTQRVAVSGATGVHDLYLVFRNRTGVANVESFQFSKQRLVRIMPLGDSITEGQANYNSFRYYLWQKLVADGHGVDFVGSRINHNGAQPPNYDFDQNHEAWSGIRADQMLPNIPGWLSAANPEIVLLHLGTNDIWQGYSPGATAARIGQIIDAIRSVKPSIKIVLAQIIPLASYEAKIVELNQALASLAASKHTSQSPIKLVDQYSGFSLSSHSYDNVHTNNAGSQRMADRWYDAVAELLG
jgi:lysophospholipase L1-like esterase